MLVKEDLQLNKNQPIHRKKNSEVFLLLQKSNTFGLSTFLTLHKKAMHPTIAMAKALIHKIWLLSAHHLCMYSILISIVTFVTYLASLYLDCLSEGELCISHQNMVMVQAWCLVQTSKTELLVSYNFSLSYLTSCSCRVEFLHASSILSWTLFHWATHDVLQLNVVKCFSRMENRYVMHVLWFFNIINRLCPAQFFLFLFYFHINFLIYFILFCFYPRYSIYSEWSFQCFWLMGLFRAHVPREFCRLSY